jgi:hypothetical protein
MGWESMEDRLVMGLAFMTNIKAKQEDKTQEQ